MEDWEPSTSYLPPTIPLKRTFRLLRQLRAATSALLASLATAERVAFQQQQQQQQSQFLSSSSRAKGKGRASEVDGDYSVRTSRRLSSGSSPFQTQAKARRYKKTATYGSRVKAASANYTSAAPSTRRLCTISPPKERRPAVPPDQKTALVQAGYSTDVVHKALHFLSAYANVMECVYDKRDGSVADSERRFKSLQEMSSREVGWAMEELATAETDGGVGNDLTSSPPRKVMVEDEDLAEQAISWTYDRWYAYSAWILPQHATRIVIDGLADISWPIMNLLLDVCFACGASSEAARFYPHLIMAGLTDLAKSRGIAATPSFLVLASRIPVTLASTPVFSALSDTLRSSFFSDRLFYSHFISLSHTSLFLSDAPNLLRLLEALMKIGGEMLETIVGSVEGAANDDDSDDGNDDAEEVASLSEELITRLAQELERASPVLLRVSSQTDLERLAADVFDIVQAYPDYSAALVPVSTIFSLFLLSKPASPSFAPETVISNLSHLDDLSSPSSSPTSSSYLDILLPILAPSELATLSIVLRDASLRKLHTNLLRRVILHRDELATRFLENDGWEQEVFEAMLLDAQASLGGSTSSMEKKDNSSAKTPAKAKVPRISETRRESPLVGNERLGLSSSVVKRAPVPRRKWRVSDATRRRVEAVTSSPAACSEEEEDEEDDKETGEEEEDEGDGLGATDGQDEDDIVMFLPPAAPVPCPSLKLKTVSYPPAPVARSPPQHCRPLVAQKHKQASYTPPLLPIKRKASRMHLAQMHDDDLDELDLLSKRTPLERKKSIGKGKRKKIVLQLEISDDELALR